MFVFLSCLEDDEVQMKENESLLGVLEWTRETKPVLRDTIPNINYQVACIYIFMDNNTLRMIYTGDDNGKPAIKIYDSNSLNDWTPSTILLK